jgi:AbiJ N-terminal domain 5
MGRTLDRSAFNPLMVAIHRAIVTTFSEGDWRALGLQTGTLRWVVGHPRLLRGVHWKNEDYPDVALTALTMILDKDFGNWNVLLGTPKLVAWLRENEPGLHAEFLGGGAATCTEHASAIDAFLWTAAVKVSKTSDFRTKLHDPLLTRLRSRADVRLPGNPKVTVFQSLHDAGCDLLIEWGAEAKYGVQLKSYHDICEDDFAVKTLSQIQDSRQHGLNRLYVLLAGDLTSKSQEQRIRAFESRVSKMNDPYVKTISPERVWTLLLAE